MGLSGSPRFVPQDEQKALVSATGVAQDGHDGAVSLVGITRRYVTLHVADPPLFAQGGHRPPSGGWKPVIASGSIS